jgi:predicted transcriptional regulator
MSSMIEIKDSHSERMQRIASEKGVMPDVLIEEALELPFQQADIEAGLKDERTFLNHLEAEDDGSFEVQTRSPFNSDLLTITHSVPIEAAILHRVAR